MQSDLEHPPSSTREDGKRELKPPLRLPRQIADRPEIALATERLKRDPNVEALDIVKRSADQKERGRTAVAMTALLVESLRQAEMELKQQPKNLVRHFTEWMGVKPSPPGSTVNLTKAAMSLKMKLNGLVEEERRPGEVLSDTTRQTNRALVAELETEPPAGMDLPDDSLKSLRLLALTLLGDRMKEAEYVQSYIDRAKLTPDECVAIHSLANDAMRHMKEIRKALGDKEPRLQEQCSELHNRLRTLCVKMQEKGAGATFEKID